MLLAEIDATGWAIIISALSTPIMLAIGVILSHLREQRRLDREAKVAEQLILAAAKVEETAAEARAAATAAGEAAVDAHAAVVAAKVAVVEAKEAVIETKVVAVQAASAVVEAKDVAVKFGEKLEIIHNDVNGKMGLLLDATAVAHELKGKDDEWERTDAKKEEPCP